MLEITSKSGIYLVVLRNEHLISVNADRPRIADRCIKVTRKNCKYGKAVNLARRRKDYVKTFGATNVDFRVLAETEFHNQIETALNGLLSPYRIKGRSGRPNEWLEGITATEVERRICEVIKSFSLAIKTPAEHARLAGVDVSNNNGTQTNLRSKRPLSMSPDLIVEALIYLQANHMSKEHLRELHHGRGNETFNAAIRYFSKILDVRDANEGYGNRLVYVMRMRSSGRNDFREMVREALVRFPK